MMIHIAAKELYEKEAAERIAREFSEGDPEWTYTAMPDPDGSGFYVVEVRDEDGEFVAFCNLPQWF